MVLVCSSELKQSFLFQNETILVHFSPCAMVEISPLGWYNRESGDGGLVKDNFQEREGGKKKIQRGCSGVKNSTWEFPTTIAASPALLRVQQSGTSQGEE